MASGAGPKAVLSAAIGRYQHTDALRSGAIVSERFTLDFADIPTINRAFAPMAREGRFDVSELAIATFLQAKAHDRPLVLLPVVLAARFQQSALLCRVDGGIHGPADLVGRRVGVRSYSQTTGVWLRGILADSFDVQPDQVRWITFEDAHVADIRDPPWAERAAAGENLLGMLKRGELDAVIVGNDVPDDPQLRTVFPDPAASAEAFWDEHGFVPVNHLVTIRREIAEARPDVVVELCRMFQDAKSAAPPRCDGRDPFPIGRAALTRPIELALRYATEQGLLSRPLRIDEVWDGLPRGLA